MILFVDEPKLIMSTMEREALDNAFAGWKNSRMPNDKESDAFEVFAAELVLKDADLSDAEITSGISGGGGDGGVDGFFFFIDRALVLSDAFVPRASQSAELNLIQATTTPGFDEKKIDKLDKFCRYLLDWEDLSNKKNLRQTAKEHMMRFRTKYKELLSHDHSLIVNLHYVTKSDHEPSSNVQVRVEEVTSYIKSKLSNAKVNFVPWGCKKLMQAQRTNPVKTLVLEKVKDFSTSDNSVVCLCKVSSYVKFLDDGKGEIKTWMMEPNVRDYQGSNKVNKQIRETLNSNVWKEDFWWLNNGVTILADACSVTGDNVSIKNPEIVNGLQTSYEIFKAGSNPALEKRHLLVKVIVAPNDESKTAIIKATNSQTSVSPISLKATEPLQINIEDELLAAGLFYDRRKGKYRQERKPIKDIVSITAMGQAIISAYLQKPSDARARPDSLLGNERYYPSIFNEENGLKFYRACILIDRRCDEYIKGTSLTDDEKTDLRYYLTMYAATELCQKAQPEAQDLIDALPKIPSILTDTNLASYLQDVHHFYVRHGGTDKTAKGREMEEAIKTMIADKYTKQ